MTAIAAICGFVLAGCAGTGMKTEASLYERLGGKPAIGAVVDDFVGNVAADQRINGRFANTDIPRLKRLLAEQICAGTGAGPAPTPAATCRRPMRA